MKQTIINNNLALCVIFFFIGFVFSTKVSAKVWTDTEVWDSQWEDRYSRWVQNEVDVDFFTKGKWAGTSTDCADAVYFARLIFSYENKLPFMIWKSSTSDQDLISNRMSRWDSESTEVERVKKFMRFVAGNVGTATLPRHTYPVEISRDHVVPGVVWSRVRVNAGNIFDYLFGGNAQGESGHAELVKEVKATGVIYLIGSTVPRAVRELILTSSFVFLPKDTSTGLRRWIQPQNRHLPWDQQPGYSLEQYSLGKEENDNGQTENPFDDFNGGSSGGGGRRTVDSFSAAVKERLKVREESKPETLERYSMDLCSLMQARAEVVKQAYAFKNKVSQRCLTASEYEALSTPSRDRRIKDTLEQLLDFNAGGSSSIFNRGWKGLGPYFDKCAAMDRGDGKPITLRTFILQIEKASSNPNDSLEVRWGFSGEDGSRHCPSW